MIASFADLWELFAPVYVTGLAIAGGLGLLGIWVVAREQIFLGAAIGQASTLGIASWLLLAALLGFDGDHAGTGDAATSVAAVAASMATALWTSGGLGSGPAHAEGRTAWIFLLAASLPVLMMAHDPHGLEEVHRLMFSTLLGVAPFDPWLFSGLALATAAAAWRWHRPLRLVAIDAEMASAAGLATRAIALVMAVWLGLALGLAIRASGLIYTFGCLVLPALAARSLCRELGPMLVVAPALGVATAVLGFVVAHVADVPPAHATVALLCAAAALGGLRRG